MNNQNSSHRTEKSTKGLLGAGLLTAFAASLCCITPVLALISGASGIASTFSWLEPIRPYLVGVTILVLGFAWYQKLKPRTKEEIQCACEEDEKPSFWKSKQFLAIVTVFAGLMMAFPYYGDIFYPKTDKQVIVVSSNDIQGVKFTVSGMTCSSCSNHISNALKSLNGVIKQTVEYPGNVATVKYDPSKTNVIELIKVIEKTGYKAEIIKTEISKK